MDGSTAVLVYEERSSDYPRIGTLPPPHFTMPILSGGETYVAEWPRRLNPTLGLRELRWFQDNVRELVGHEGQWIAILGRQIVASSDSFAEVRDRLARDGIRDALILRVPADAGRREYFIG